MIKNRLSVLLAERGLRITRVAKDTGISRNTLTATSQNDTEMIRLETINTLCKYFNITPSDFFEYRPIDLEFTLMINEMIFDYDNNEKRFIFRQMDADLFLDIKDPQRVKTVSLTCELDLEATQYDLLSVIGKRTFTLNVDFEEDEVKYQIEKEYLSKLGPFYPDIYAKLVDTIKSSLKEYLLDSMLEKLTPFYNVHSDEPFECMGIDSLDKFDVTVYSESFLPF